MRRLLRLGLSAGLFLAACRPAAATPTHTATPLPSATRTPLPTLTATPTLAPTASASPTPTPTARPTSTPPPTATRTATPDVYDNVALSLDDLPNGFVPLTGADLVKLHLSPDAIRQGFGNAYSEAQLHSLTVFLFRKESAIQILAAFFYYPLSDLELHSLTNALLDPKAAAAVLGFATQSNGAQAQIQVLKGLDALGHARLGLSARLPQASGPALRADLVIVRRGRVAEYAVSFYADNTRPAMGVIDLAKILDGHVVLAQTPK